ncbi:MAG: hypothetical protein SVS85_01235, partial [Candidatus Nanohaloarchaea archaeon]|nr:hypothetical protein [Candidatus Nanohaloarchaea archaeon]
KQIQVLQLAVERGAATPTGRVKRICGSKSEAKRVLHTLDSRGLLEFKGYGEWVPTGRAEAMVEEQKRKMAEAED